MDWTDDKVREAGRQWAVSIRAVMDYAVELVAARGGTMTAGALEDLIARIRRSFTSFGNEFAGLLDLALAEVERHIASQGATVATLEAEVARYNEAATHDQEKHDALQAERDEWQEKWRGASELARWVLEGDAPQEATARHVRACPLSPDAPVPAPDGTACECDCIRRDAARLAAPVGRYPCSPACAHDDAATPGHPERVNALSAEMQAGPDAAEMKWAQTSVEFDRGAEAMRAACWEAVRVVLQKHGWSGDHVFNDFKVAIEGATP